MTDKDTHSKKCIFIPKDGQSARLYVEGVYVNELSETTFSYNARVAWELSHDVNAANDLFDLVEKALNSDDFSKAHAVHYWESVKARTEGMETLHPVNITNEVACQYLFDGFHEVFGKQTCVYTDSAFTLQADTFGWEVIFLRNSLAKVAMHAGVKSDSMVVKTFDDFRNIILDEMTGQERDRLRIAKMILQALGFDDIDIVIVKEFTTDGFTRKGNHGLYRKDERDMLIAYEVLTGLYDDTRMSALNFLIIVLHEAGHHETQAPDGSSEFVNFFVSQWMTSLLVPYKEVAKLIRQLLEA